MSRRKSAGHRGSPATRFFVFGTQLEWGQFRRMRLPAIGRRDGSVPRRDSIRLESPVRRLNGRA